MTAAPAPAEATRTGVLATFLLFAVLCHLRVYWGAWDALDIGLWDESVYLEAGVTLSWRNMTTYGADSFLYRGWYRLLALVFEDRIDVYMANWVVTPLLVAGAMGLVVARSTATQSLLVLCVPAFVFLVAIRSFELWPRITMFLALFCLLALLAVRRARSPASAFLALAAAAFAASYIRAEMVLAVPAALAVAAAAAWRLPGPARRRAAIGVAAVAAACVAIGTVFVHPALDNGIRQQLAMGQHLAIDWVRLNNADADGFRDAEEIIPTIFGAETRWWRWPAMEPAFALNHVGYTLRRLPVEAAAFLNHPPLILPGSSRSARLAEAAALGAAVLGVLALALLRDGRGFLRRRRVELGAMAILAMPQIVASIVLYPHAHYLLTPFVLGLVVVGMAMAHLRVGEGWRQRHVVLGVAALLLLTPRGFGGAYATRYATAEGAPARPTVATIRQFRDLGFVRPLRILTHDYGYVSYLPGVLFEAMMRQMGPRPFVAFLFDLRPDVIIVDAGMSRSWRLKDDLSWKNFIADPAAAGYRPVAVRGTDRQILVRSTLRCRHPACGP